MFCVNSLVGNGVMPSLPEYGASSSSNIVEDDQQPGTSKQVNYMSIMVT